MCNDCPHQIEDTVYLAVAHSHSSEEVPCPVCFGKRSVVLILGNDEHQPVECGFCGAGYEGPRGVVQEYRASSTVQSFVVTGIGRDTRGWYVVSGHQQESLADGNVFAVWAEAEVRRVDLHTVAEGEARRRWEQNLGHQKKQPTWSAGYHREQLKELRRKVQWHEEKLSAKLPVKE